MATTEQITRPESTKAAAFQAAETRKAAFKAMQKLESLRHTKQETKLHKAEADYLKTLQAETAVWHDYELASKGL